MQKIQLYNTRTKSVETFEPLNPPTVTVYTCGPTVYDYPHVGNWFTFIRYDVLIRALKHSGYRPAWVMNITDVGHLVSDADEGQDKLEKGAAREGKSAWEIASFYTTYFENGLERLRIVRPDKLPRATDHIIEQVELIKTLEQKGYTYVIDDGVYFDTAKFPDYATFARLDLDELKAGARVSENTDKRNPADFALWKFSPKNQQRDMEWDSPWGKGFPGWHIECSAMAMKYLGETIDIHAGGIDHIPVHHTNEIAQSEAATGKLFAKTWVHTNHVTVEGEKISKSLGNGVTLEDIVEKGYSLLVFRLLVLESHYRSQSKFTWEALEAAKNRLDAYYAMADMRWQATAIERNFSRYQDRHVIEEDIRNDLNTPSALAVLSAAATDIVETGIHPDEVEEFEAFLASIDELFGLDLSERSDISDEQKKLLIDRENARINKEWKVADETRARLEAEGIGVRDTPTGSQWYRL